MISQIPHPIQRTLLKTILLGAAVLSFGAIWGIVSQDKVFLILSAAVGILGGAKVLSLYHTVKAGRYETLEGFVLSDRAVPLRNRHVLTLEGPDQEISKVILAGKAVFRPGAEYRLYLAGHNGQDPTAALPEYLQPVRSLLGYEELD